MRLLKLFLFRQLAIVSLLLNKRLVAIRYWEQILFLKPNDPIVPAAIAHLKAELGLTHEAIALLLESLAIDEFQPNVWYNLGFLHQGLNEHALAIVAFDKAMGLNEKSDLAMYGKALSLIKQQRLQEAIPLLIKNTELQPLSPYGWYQLAHVYYRLGDLSKLKKTIAKVGRFEPSVALQLQRETGVDAGIESAVEGRGFLQFGR
jgi:tetratricopeptide (TPR) repeat protein